MRPHDVVRTVVNQHAALRELLTDLRVMARSVLDGATHLERELAAQVSSLIGHVHQHLNFEETRWAPLMQNAGIWSGEREAEQREDHAAVRAALGALEAHQRTLGPEFARAAVDLADTFEAQTDNEDGQLLQLMGMLGRA